MILTGPLGKTFLHFLQFHVRSPQALKLRIILRDHKNRLFDNFTSLDVSWSSNNYNMASFDLSDTAGVQMEYQEDIFSQHRMKSTCKYRAAFSSNDILNEQRKLLLWDSSSLQ